MENPTTNGTTTPATKGPSLLTTIHDAWLKNGAKKPDAKTLAALKAELAAVTDEFQAASAALEAARVKRGEVSAKVMKACGTKGQIKLADGRLLEASSRGDQVFFKMVTGETY